MATSPDLLRAILAMDAYNRSYNEGMAGLGGEGAMIGLATAAKDSSELKDANGNRLDLAASFFAQAYRLPDGTTVCSCECLPPGTSPLSQAYGQLSYVGRGAQVGK